MSPPPSLPPAPPPLSAFPRPFLRLRKSNRVEFSVQANLSAPIIRRANYVSGRDQKSVNALSELLSILKNARTKPDEVARVRDPVLSDGYFKDISGRCWRQSQGG